MRRELTQEDIGTWIEVIYTNSDNVAAVVLLIDIDYSTNTKRYHTKRKEKDKDADIVYFDVDGFSRMKGYRLNPKENVVIYI